MSIELMRRIDYWVGIPLCFLLTGIHHILRFLVFKREYPVLKKVLFIKLSEMGSIILAYPLVNRVRNEYPGTEIFFLTFKENKPLLEILSAVTSGNIITIRRESIRLFILDTLTAIWKVRKKRLDIVFDLEFFSRFSAILTYLAGAFKRVGFYRYTIEGLYRGNLLTHRVQYNPLLHISKSYLSLWQAQKAQTKSTPALEENIKDEEFSLPEFMPSQNGLNAIWERLKLYKPSIDKGNRLLLLNPGEGRIPLREWPLDNFITLAKRLLEDSKNYIAVIGARPASGKGELVCKSVNGERCLNLTGETSISEVLSLCNIAAALIINDSGLAHLASLTPVKKFIFFGPESPHVYSPLGKNTHILYSNLPCSPCLSVFNHRNSACTDNRCLKMIKPDEVYEIIQKCL